MRRALCAIYIYMSHTSRRIPQISVCNFNKYSKLRRLGMRRALCAIYIYMSHTPRRIPQNRRLQLQHISDSLIWVCDAPYAPYIYICRTPHVAYPLPNYWCGYAPGMRRVFSGYAPWVCATGGIDRNRRKHMHLRVGFGASKDTGVLAAGHMCPIFVFSLASLLSSRWLHVWLHVWLHD